MAVNKIKQEKIKAVDVYFQKRKSRKYVGQLFRKDDKFIFIYSDLYLLDEKSIPIGPDLPLSKKKFTSNNLFHSFEDRIPSKNNPAYAEYCEMVGIKSSEKDLLTLVATLGQKGPSSFIFSPTQKSIITSEDIANFRKMLKLTVREFSDLFDFAPATINRIEKKSILGKESMKRLEIYCLFPEIALHEVTKNRFKVNEVKMNYAVRVLRAKIDEERNKIM